MDRKLFFQIHKWLGLVTGLIVFIICITGCIYIFYDELKLKIYPDRFLLSENYRDQQPLPLSKLIASAEAALKNGEKLSRVDLYPAKNRSWVFRFTGINKKGFGFNRYYKYYWRVYVNPYTGSVVKVEDAKKEFFQLVLHLHRGLLLGDTYGTPVTGTAVALFSVLLITGLVLWFPRRWTKKNLKKRVWLDTTVKWKRLVYDIHHVAGFYGFLLAFVVCITGLVFAFDGVKKSYTGFFNLFCGTQNIPHQPVPPVAARYEDPLDNALYHTLSNNPGADMMSVRMRGATSKEIDIQVRLTKDRTGDFKWYYFDSTGQQVARIRTGASLPLGERLVSLNYDIHTGNLLGMSSKLIQFILILFCASLPVTGYIMWWNKSTKIKKRRTGSHL
ncbi:PepSY-associated TM helix domain-containing protein [Niabella beijingensis]|uniref:PepSY-associated TM helix domain-containing protein n=1 Tax=Niabella beijingensis TaxID=2872700 RepID=UPI001CBDC9DE|nr:PepSY-associated TM helix domain-containing protein [Niabella beijingensis]MBZ4192485.1 PepSY domain-containing protein [Niabella beijingensis]